jgi:hypothetical protein
MSRGLPEIFYQRSCEHAKLKLVVDIFGRTIFWASNEIFRKKFSGNEMLACKKNQGKERTKKNRSCHKRLKQSDSDISKKVQQQPDEE